jgi:hypothetical protein
MNKNNTMVDNKNTRSFARKDFTCPSKPNAAPDIRGCTN